MKRFAVTCDGLAVALSCAAANPRWRATILQRVSLGGLRQERSSGLPGSSPPPVYYVAATTACLCSELLLDARQTGVGCLPRDLVQAAHSSLRLI
jgi:hypothetical protein